MSPDPVCLFVGDQDPTTTTLPTRADSDLDGVPDGAEDRDHDGQRTECRSYAPCKEGTDVVMCAVEGGGHSWPGGKPVLNLRLGSIYFFSRDRPQETQLRTPTVSAAIRGTEFEATVAPDGRTTLTMIAGQVELAEHGGAVQG